NRGRSPAGASARKIGMSTAALLAELLSGEDQRAEQAALALAHKQPSALPELYKLLESPDPEQRWWAIRAIAECEPAPQTSLYLLAALADDSSQVRQAAALAFCHQPDPQAIPALIRALSDPNPLVASLAGNALTLLKADALPRLMAALENEQNPTARRGIVRSLAEIGDPIAIPSLMKALASDSALLQYWAEHGLEKMGLGMIYLKPS
ncbi:MAG: HEAT repeat domain-containing protein, partial [Anaerolineales bacterium]|nr:HEAT repeat domain-containing protein [Anaerolineales bacterium]